MMSEFESLCQPVNSFSSKCMCRSCQQIFNSKIAFDKHRRWGVEIDGKNGDTRLVSRHCKPRHQLKAAGLFEALAGGWSEVINWARK